MVYISIVVWTETECSNWSVFQLGYVFPMPQHPVVHLHINLLVFSLTFSLNFLSSPMIFLRPLLLEIFAYYLSSIPLTFFLIQRVKWFYLIKHSIAIISYCGENHRMNYFIWFLCHMSFLQLADYIFCHRVYLTFIYGSLDRF